MKAISMLALLVSFIALPAFADQSASTCVNGTQVSSINNNTNPNNPVLQSLTGSSSTNGGSTSSDSVTVQ